jgi:putative membrane protein
MKKYNRQQVATAIALAFHISGFIAIGLFNSALFISLTPLNLLVCAALIFWTQEKINVAFISFCLLAFLVGFAAEYVGIHTGKLFGQYSYGEVLGPKWNDVPYMIGIQWLVTIYCIGVGMHMFHQRLINRQPNAYGKFPKWWVTLSLIGDGALLAVLFDWVIEPVAIRLGYWKWADGEIPMLNYYSWWGVSALLLGAFHFLQFKKQNLFALHLLLIQFMFFLLLLTFN